jgi:hypothetical protein
MDGYKKADPFQCKAQVIISFIQYGMLVKTKKLIAAQLPAIRSILEAAPGLEPGNNGFADRRLSHLATPPLKQVMLNIR